MPPPDDPPSQPKSTSGNTPPQSYAGITPDHIRKVAPEFDRLVQSFPTWKKIPQKTQGDIGQLNTKDKAALYDFHQISLAASGRDKFAQKMTLDALAGILSTRGKDFVPVANSVQYDFESFNKTGFVENMLESDKPFLRELRGAPDRDSYSAVQEPFRHFQKLYGEAKEVDLIGGALWGQNQGRSPEQVIHTIGQQKVLEGFLDINYLTKKIAKETAFDGFRGWLQSGFNALPPSLQDAAAGTLRFAQALPGPEKEAYTNTVVHAAFAVSGMEDKQFDSIWQPQLRPNEPVQSIDRRFEALRYDALQGWLAGQQALRDNPNSPETAFRQALASINNDIRRNGQFGAQLNVGAPKPDGPVVYYQGPQGQALRNPSKPLADAFQQAAASVKLNLFIPGPTKRNSSVPGATDLAARDSQLDLPPAVQQLSWLNTAAARANTQPVGNSQRVA